MALAPFVRSFCLLPLLFILWGSFFPSGLIPSLNFPSFLHPPGIRTEQDFYVRLIDSMTKQVSFLEFHIVGTILSSQNSLRFKNWLCHH